MGTYAVYRVWAGILKNDIDEISHPFIKRALNSSDNVKKGGLDFKSIAMHGEVIGLGVEIQELNWETEINESNLFDITSSNRAEETCQRVNKIFKDLGISLTAKIYHHIDLGG